MSSLNQVKITELMHKVAKENNVTFAEVDRAVRSIFESVAEIIKEDKINTIYLRYLGSFGSKTSRLKSIERSKQKALDKKLKDEQEII